jgi:mono/diheme cytochrome c family protein
MLQVSLAALFFGMAAFASAAESSAAITFNRDILPILQKNCQQCHRPGEVAPMSFLTYKDARPWAKAMKTAVVTGKMPPWFADPKYGHFANNPTLSVKDVDALVTWADNGAPEGDAKDKPVPATFQDGWNIKPDMIIEMPKEFHVPAKGTINYQNILVKVNFPEDKWVVAAEMRPGNPQVVHHMRGDIRGPNSHWMADAIPGEAYESGDDVMNKNDEGENLLGKFNPGLGAQEFSEEGAAKFVPKGSDFVFNIHYTAIGKPTTDRSRIGLVFAKNPPSVRYYTANVPLALNLVIPPGENNAEVVGEVTLQRDVKLVYVQPHMHVRGKDYELRAVYPTGETDTIMKGKWDFNWQLGYELAKPMFLPKGTRLIGISHFDNSAVNSYNPDPTKEVRWGPQNWDEMSAAFIGILIPDLKTDLRTVFKASGPSLLPAVPGRSGPTLTAVVVPAAH